VGPLLALAVALLAADAAALEPAPSGTVVVSVSGLRSRAGSLRVKLVREDDGFPASDARLVAKRRLPIEGPRMRVAFPDVPLGDYAVVVLHDEDDDATLDRGLLGIPVEGLGFSSGARVRFGPPSFEEARFRLREASLEIAVEVRY
jgi:uncharacterized protein (DUF2141 family)